MKSLVEHISETLLNESKKDLDALVRVINDGDAQRIFDEIKKVVDNNSNNEIDSKETDDMEDGMFVGYLPDGIGDQNFATIAIVSRKSTDDSKQWIIMTDSISKQGSDIGIEIEDFKNAKLHANYFGNGWKIIYYEHVDEDLLNAVLSIK